MSATCSNMSKPKAHVTDLVIVLDVDLDPNHASIQ